MGELTQKEAQTQKQREQAEATRQAFNKRTGMNREERRRMIKKWSADKTLDWCPSCGYRTPRKTSEEGETYCVLCKAILERRPKFKDAEKVANDAD